MPLELLLDENLRDRGLWAAITQHNAKRGLDVVRVGDADGPPLGILDPELIAWAAANGRILVGLDKSTLVSKRMWYDRLEVIRSRFPVELQNEHDCKLPTHLG